MNLPSETPVTERDTAKHIDHSFDTGGNFCLICGYKKPCDCEFTPTGGLINAIGAWKDFDKIQDFIDDLYKQRENR